MISACNIDNYMPHVFVNIDCELCNMMKHQYNQRNKSTKNTAVSQYLQLKIWTLCAEHKWKKCSCIVSCTGASWNLLMSSSCCHHLLLPWQQHHPPRQHESAPDDHHALWVSGGDIRTHDMPWTTPVKLRVSCMGVLKTKNLGTNNLTHVVSDSLVADVAACRCSREAAKLHQSSIYPPMAFWVLDKPVLTSIAKACM